MWRQVVKDEHVEFCLSVCCVSPSQQCLRRICVTHLLLPLLCCLRFPAHPIFLSHWHIHNDMVFVNALKNSAFMVQHRVNACIAVYAMGHWLFIAFIADSITSSFTTCRAYGSHDSGMLTMAIRSWCWYMYGSRGYGIATESSDSSTFAVNNNSTTEWIRKEVFRHHQETCIWPCSNVGMEFKAFSSYSYQSSIIQCMCKASGSQQGILYWR